MLKVGDRMIVTPVVLDTFARKEEKSQNGISFHIQTKNHSILFDLSQSGNFIKNCARFGVDVKKVDTVVVSHGHVTHGGGLREFLKANDIATIYIQEEAFSDYYTELNTGEKIAIGLDKELGCRSRFCYIRNQCIVDDEIRLFTRVSGRRYLAPYIQQFYEKYCRSYRWDYFHHELYLIIKEEEQYYLFVGCAHRGIVNVMEAACEYVNHSIGACFGGFHLHNQYKGIDTTEQNLFRIARSLQEYKTQFYTCACTGENAYEYLKEYMGMQMNSMVLGKKIEI